MKRDSLYVVPVELTGMPGEGRTVLHARAEIVLAKQVARGHPLHRRTSSPRRIRLENGELYDPERLFHGPDLQGIEHVDGCSAKGIAALVKAAPQPASWIRQPFRNTWLTDPLVMDCAFQLMILWSFERFGSGSLPCFAGTLPPVPGPFPAKVSRS